MHLGVLLAKLRLVTQNLAGVDEVVTSGHENLPIAVRGKLWRHCETPDLLSKLCSVYPLRKWKGIMIMKRSQQSIAFQPIADLKVKSRLVRRLVQASDDPAKQRVRRLLVDIDDERLLGFGLTPDDIVALRGTP